MTAHEVIVLKKLSYAENILSAKMAAIQKTPCKLTQILIWLQNKIIVKLADEILIFLKGRWKQSFKLTPTGCPQEKLGSLINTKDTKPGEQRW